ncbi:hypothetical protein K2X33_11390 [bacterium]|nr:hypothetical protein [bacterium]
MNRLILAAVAISLISGSSDAWFWRRNTPSRNYQNRGTYNPPRFGLCPNCGRYHLLDSHGSTEPSGPSPQAPNRHVAQAAPPQVEPLKLPASEVVQLATKTVSSNGVTPVRFLNNQNFHKTQYCIYSNGCRSSGGSTGWGCPNISIDRTREVFNSRKKGAIWVHLKSNIDAAQFMAAAKKLGFQGLTLDYKSGCDGAGSPSTASEGVLHYQPGDDQKMLNLCSQFLGPYVASPMHTIECSYITQEKYDAAVQAWSKDTSRIVHYQ